MLVHSWLLLSTRSQFQAHKSSRAFPLCRWCPIKEAPYILREDEDSLTMQSDSLSKLTSDIMPVGTIREFMVS